MEFDRVQVDLGIAVEAEAVAEEKQQERQPRRRFIGRKEAAERAEGNGEPSASIKDKGAIQRM